MYLALGIICGVTAVIAIFGTVVIIGISDDEPIAALVWLALVAIAIGTGVWQSKIHKPYTVELPESAVQVVGQVYQFEDGNFYKKAYGVNQTFEDYCAHGSVESYELVDDADVLEMLLDCYAPSARQWAYMQELAEKLDVTIPEITIVESE